jgi:uncharacterized membrane protein (UPF0127 family)
VVVAVLAVICIPILIFLFLIATEQYPTVRFPDGTFIAVEIADDAEERRIGLSEHIFLDPDRGMLFLFDEPTRPAFWMKDMKFPIDIVWLRDGTIVGIDRNLPVPADGTRELYMSEADSNQVLEVNAGFAKDHGLKMGQTLDIKLP